MNKTNLGLLLGALGLLATLGFNPTLLLGAALGYLFARHRR
jgi:hypothetical protein